MALTPLTTDPNATPSSGNPLLDQIGAVRQPSDLVNLHPAAKDVLESVYQQRRAQEMGGAPMSLGGQPQQQQPAGPAPLTRPAPAQPLNLSALAKPNAGPAPMMPHPPTSAPMSPNVQGAENEVNRLNSTGSGISQIHNPWGRIPLQILDAVGGSFFPKISALLPGTELHHDRLVGEAEGNLKNQEGLEKDQAANAETAARTTELGAQADSLAHPKDEITPISTADGYVGVSKHTGKAEPITVNGEQAQPVEKAIQPHYTTTPDGSVLAISTDKNGEHKTETVYQGTAKQQPKAVTLEVGGKPHTVIVDESTGKTIKDLGETGEKPPSVNVNSGTWQLDEDPSGKPVLFNSKTGETKAAPEGLQKSGTSAKGNALASKTFAPAMDSAERFNVMSNNYDDAVKNHDQQAMLSLLAQHLGMTMGGVKGAKLNKQIIEEAQNSQPFLQGIGAKFDKDGYLSGVTLSQPQMKQMVDLGRQRFAEDTSKARSEARYAGVKDDGPDRTPNTSTIHHYLSLTNGDVSKAKELAAQDGWSFPKSK